MRGGTDPLPLLPLHREKLEPFLCFHLSPHTGPKTFYPTPLKQDQNQYESE